MTNDTQVTAITKNEKKDRTKKGEFVKTLAVRRYADEAGITRNDVADMAGVPHGTFAHYYRENRYPRKVLDALGIKARNGRKSSGVKVQKAEPKKGGSLYTCYVEGEHLEAFKSFCSALKINAVFVM